MRASGASAGYERYRAGARRMSERDAPASDAAELHRPVLRDTVLRWLTPLPPGAWIVDATVGLAGHAAALLEQAAESQLLGLDRDAATLELAARRLAPFGSRVVLRQADFRDLAREATATGVEAAHAILFDLGLSSYQLPGGDRGFSFRTDERLDMRSDIRQSLTAAEVVRTTSEPDLARLLAVYGEEPAARRIARRIVAARGRTPLTTTKALADLVVAAIPPHRRP